MGDNKKCAEIFRKPQDQRQKLYEQYIDSQIKTQDTKALLGAVTHFVRVEGQDQFGRTYITPPLLTYLIKEVGNDKKQQKAGLPEFDYDLLLDFAKKTIEILRPEEENFPDALMHAIELLSRLHQDEGEFKQAAYVLSSFRFDKGGDRITASSVDKVKWFVNTAEFWLAAGDAGSASQHIKRAHVLATEPEVKREKKLMLRFKTCYARVLDSDRKFIEAAMRYLELSQQGGMSEGDLLTTLQNAVTCAILAKAGPSRSRVLAMLYSDERSRNLPNFSLLEKMFKERIIRNPEVEQFEKLLADHQKAATSNGLTVLQNSVMEHNILAAAQMYNNIKFDQLGTLLGIPPEKAERLASEMIEQGRMKAVIDQIEGIIEFEAGAGSGSLHTWDSQIQDVCTTVNSILEQVAKKWPQYKNF